MNIDKYVTNGLCNDNIVGTICKQNDSIITDLYMERCERQMYIYKHPIKDSIDCENIIVIVLESPSTDEFKTGFIAPALGKTGANIKNYLATALNEHKDLFDENIEYYLLLMNPVQHQCNLNGNNKAEIFLEFWYNYKACDTFLSRLNCYCPKIIINACTDITVDKKLLPKNVPEEQLHKASVMTGKDYKKGIRLKAIVQVKINEYKKSISETELFYSSHPSNWTINRSVKRIKKND